MNNGGSGEDSRDLFQKAWFLAHWQRFQKFGLNHRCSKLKILVILLRLGLHVLKIEDEILFRL